jgi:CRISPR/Cas system CSM-associated protein Csm5 (group 7 of RAMP superfamily)
LVNEKLGYQTKSADTLSRFTRAVQYTAVERIRQEMQYHSNRQQTLPLAFYARLDQMVKHADFEKSNCLLQIGFATGWRSKSVLGGLANSDPLLGEIVDDFQMDRGGKNADGGFTPEQGFPKARHLAYHKDSPAEPMGWLKLTATRLRK